MPRPTTCDSPQCDAPLWWRPHVRTGRMAPVDPHPDPHGNVVLEGDSYRVLTKDELKALDTPNLFSDGSTPVPVRHTLHFATCPDSAHWRRCRTCHRHPCVCPDTTTNQEASHGS